MKTPTRKYEEALAWVDFYKQNKRFVSISRRTLNELKTAHENFRTNNES